MLTCAGATYIPPYMGPSTARDGFVQFSWIFDNTLRVSCGLGWGDALGTLQQFWPPAPIHGKVGSA